VEEVLEAFIAQFYDDKPPPRHVLLSHEIAGQGLLAAALELKAGHTYELHADRTTGHGYRKYFWITDAASGEVVAGEKMP